MLELSRQELMFLVEPHKADRFDTQWCKDHNLAEGALVETKVSSVILATTSVEILRQSKDGLSQPLQMD